MSIGASRLLFIFDLDGTLIDSREDLATAVNLTRSSYGLAPLPVETVTRLVGEGVRLLMTRALEGAAADLDEAVRRQKAFYLEHLCDRTTLYPGVADGLAALGGAGHLLAVATNKPVEPTERILRHFGIRERFARVLGGGSVPNLKPEPDMALRIMEELAMPASATWMVGDHVTDLETARRAGIASVFLEGGMGVAGGETHTRAFPSFAAFARAFLIAP